jgi:CheY-like chemotaxis protein
LPAVIHTDEKRLQQILKNLLSNAIKFTEKGKVDLRITLAKSGWTPGHPQLDAAEKVVAFAVTDTGIGIPENKKKVIFEAFQQADGTTSRKYGGTGLGLSISRELTRLLGGEIRVESAPGKGSTFTLYLPFIHEPTGVDARIPKTPAEETAAEETLAEETAAEETPAEEPKLGPAYAKRSSVRPGLKGGRAAHALPQVSDDRENLQPGDRVVLIVEDDAKFAATVLDVARESGFKGVVALDGSTALVLVKEFSPDAITLDLKLPDMDGWAVLDLLKHDPGTRHIPVSVISVTERMHKCLHMGALGTVQKPAVKEALQEALAKTRRIIEHEIRTLLVVDGNDAERTSITEALRGEGVQITGARAGKQALDALRKNQFDCMVLGPTLRDMTAIDLIKKIVQSTASELPIVIYQTDTLSGSERNKLRKLAEVAVLKSARTLEAVLEETTLFLHQTVNGLPMNKRHQLLAAIQRATPDLAGSKVLIVDDDIRNIFALTGALEQHDITVLNAENGKDGLETLKNNPDIDVVLMDIMMPELDGYDTIRIIRRLEQFKNLPIIAVTAKAMKGDREKCIEAGASDYISKPVNMEQLLSLLRVGLDK